MTFSSKNIVLLCVDAKAMVHTDTQYFNCFKTSENNIGFHKKCKGLYNCQYK